MKLNINISFTISDGEKINVFNEVDINISFTISDGIY